MANVFIYSNSFATMTFLYELSYLVNFNVDNIHLLSENHKISDITHVNHPHVLLHKSVEDCFKCCDVVFIIHDDEMPVKYINHIKNISVVLSIKCVEILNPWKHEIKNNNHTYCNNKIHEYSSVNFSAITLIALGLQSQQYCSEILLNKILTENNIEFMQCFSQITLNLLLQLDSYNILNENLLRHLKTPSNTNCLCVYSFDVDNDYLNISQDSMLQYSDFIIVQTGAKFDSFEILQNIVKYGYNKNIDIFAKSQFDYSDNECLVFFEEQFGQNSQSHNIYAKKFESFLIARLFTKMSLPDGVIDY